MRVKGKECEKGEGRKEKEIMLLLAEMRKEMRKMREMERKYREEVQRASKNKRYGESDRNTKQ